MSVYRNRPLWVACGLTLAYPVVQCELGYGEIERDDRIIHKP